MYSLIFLLNFFLSTSLYINAEIISNNEISYPTLWQTVPESLTEYPLVDDDNSSSQYRLIDPWFYPHRLGLYKILINITTPLMPFCSSSNASNILFALPSQFGWQYDSNRLFTNGTLNISLNSWWASANYYLSVIPFLAAIDVGLIPYESFRIVQYENFCSNSIQCFKQVAKAMEQWHKFFIHLQQSHKNIDDRILDNDYLGPMWLAYEASIENALPLIQSKLSYLPSNVERLFGYSWGRLINLIAMTRKNTNLYETIKNQRTFLPRRMLLESDRLTQTNDLPELVNKSLQVLFSFRFDWLTYIEKIWSKLTCNYEARIYAQYTLESMATSKFLALKYLTQAMINAILFQCDTTFKIDL
ncbi:unnamed protein product [Adineta steineri]|uniref:Uncharacterized protein n=1 Tax=Adineta steineri TaxID=433720 RepID=A0A814MSF1_9BILA|nr:unnamed protein product [Adineta steineri]CAF3681811.1 unnamed protein product [Adineta steineri]